MTPDASMSVLVHIVSVPSNICTIHGPSAFQPGADSEYVQCALKVVWPVTCVGSRDPLGSALHRGRSRCYCRF